MYKSICATGRKTLAGLLAVLAALFLNLTAALPAFAAQSAVVDNDVLFNTDEIEKMEEMARKIASEYGINVLILTDYQDGFSDNYARDLIEETGVQKYPDGYLAFCINMADRSYWVDAYGDDVREIFTQDVTDSLADDAYDHLSDGEYGQAAIAVLKNADRIIQVKSTPYGWLKKPLIYPEKTIILSGIALLVSIGLTWGVTYSELRGHHEKKLASGASAYGSDLNLNVSRDQFMSHYQTRVRRPKSSSSGGSGGGGSAGHTGSGGHF